MMRRTRTSLAILIPLATVALGASSWSIDAPIEFTDIERRRILQHRAVPLPPSPTNRVADDPRAARLGQMLFFEERFSANGQVSCATCHDPAQGFSDGLPVSVGLEELDRHSPSLWNTAYNRWFFWDGRADSLWAQAIKPFEDPREYGSTRTDVLRLIAGDDELRLAYEEVFGTLPDVERMPPGARPVPADAQHPHAVTWATIDSSTREAVNIGFANVGKAIAAYERRLISTNSPFDRFADELERGVPAADRSLDPAAQRGLKLFVGKANCRLCHAGPNFTDGEFHNNGLPTRDGRAGSDSGRYKGIPQLLADPFNGSGAFSDDPTSASDEKVRGLVRTAEAWGQFKTPGLRNIADSPPFMHLGQFETLEAVIRFYSTLEGQVLVGHHQETILVATHLTESEQSDLVAFLMSLQGERIDDSLLEPVRPLRQEP